MRSALALGWDGCVFLKGSVDPFNDKVLRASQGACFTLPTAVGDWEGIRNALFSSKTSTSSDPFHHSGLMQPWTCYVADVQGESIDDAFFSLEKQVREWKRIGREKKRDRKDGNEAAANGVELPRIALILGNETRGASENAAKCGQLVRIPMSPHMESLNVGVAGAILMHLIRAKTAALADELGHTTKN